MSSITNEANNILNEIKQTGGKRRKASKKSKKSKKSMKGGNAQNTVNQLGDKRKSKKSKKSLKGGKRKSKKSKNNQKGGDGCNECSLDDGEKRGPYKEGSSMVDEYLAEGCAVVQHRTTNGPVEGMVKVIKPPCDNREARHQDALKRDHENRRFLASEGFSVNEGREDRNSPFNQAEHDRRMREQDERLGRVGIKENSAYLARSRGGRRRYEDDYPRRNSRYRGDYDHYRGGNSETAPETAPVTAPVEIAPVTQLGGKSKKSKKSIKGGSTIVAPVQVGGKKRKSKKSKKSMKGGDGSTIITPAQVGGKRKSIKGGAVLEQRSVNQLGGKKRKSKKSKTSKK